MLLPNARRILKSGPSLTTLKLLLMAGAFSRPHFRTLCLTVLRLFARQGEVPVRFSSAGREYTAFVRLRELSSDYFTVLEIAIRGTYNLNSDFLPDLVIDCGGNIGLFSLAASAMYPDSSIVICEPVPGNVEQIKKHLSANHVAADVLPVCVGGARRTIPFFVREAIASSFDPHKPYTKELEIEVWTLADLVQRRDAQRILIKLDIEGMEIETLESYLPNESRAVRIVGELHDHHANRNYFEQIFRNQGWTLRFMEITDQGSVFEAYSPAAIGTEATHASR